MATLIEPMSPADYKLLAGFLKALTLIFGKLVTSSNTASITITHDRIIFLGDIANDKYNEQQIGRINLYAQETLDELSQYVILRYKGLTMCFLQTQMEIDNKTYHSSYLLKTDLKTFMGDDIEYRQIILSLEILFSEKECFNYREHNFYKRSKNNMFNELKLRRVFALSDKRKREENTEENVWKNYLSQD